MVNNWNNLKDLCNDILIGNEIIIRDGLMKTVDGFVVIVCNENAKIYKGNNMIKNVDYEINFSKIKFSEIKKKTLIE